jgi:hypothetical protein
MSAKTGWLSQIVVQEPDPNKPDYPPLSAEERRVLKVVANGLYLSESAVQWSYWNSQQGDKDGWRRVLEILSAGKLKVVK